AAPAAGSGALCFSAPGPRRRPRSSQTKSAATRIPTQRDGDVIEIRDLSFSYRTGEADAVPALRGLDLRVEPGQLVAIIGHNGSGKSTLVKLLTAVLYPTEGEIRIDGLPVDREDQWDIRRKVSVVFQDPDDQLVMNRVVDDVAFGPENLGLPRDEISERIELS